MLDIHRKLKFSRLRFCNHCFLVNAPGNNVYFIRSEDDAPEPDVVSEPKKSHAMATGQV